MKRTRQYYDNLRKSFDMTMRNTDVHYKAMQFYKFVYKLTKSELAEKKFNEHQITAMTELYAQLGICLNEINYLEQYLKGTE